MFELFAGSTVTSVVTPNLLFVGFHYLGLLGGWDRW